MGTRKLGERKKKMGRVPTKLQKSKRDNGGDRGVEIVTNRRTAVEKKETRKMKEWGATLRVGLERRRENDSKVVGRRGERRYTRDHPKRVANCGGLCRERKKERGSGNK